MSNGDGNGESGESGESGEDSGSTPSGMGAVLGDAFTGLTAADFSGDFGVGETSSNETSESSESEESEESEETFTFQTEEQDLQETHFISNFLAQQQHQTEVEESANQIGKVVTVIVDTLVTIVTALISPIVAIASRGGQQLAGTTIGQQAGKAVANAIQGGNKGLSFSVTSNQDSQNNVGGYRNV